MYSVEKIYDSIGCFYSFDRCVIISSEIKLDKSGNKVLILNSEYYTHFDIDEIISKLKSFKSSRKIKINKNTGLNIYFHGLLKEIDINNQDEIDSIINVYKSLINKNRLIFKSDFDESKNINLKALYMCLYNFKISKLKDIKRNCNYPIRGIAG